MISNKEKENDKALELDNADFVVTQENYEKFLVALDESPESIPALEKIFSVEKYQRQRFLEGLGEDFKALKKNAQAWQEELEERGSLE